MHHDVPHDHLAETFLSALGAARHERQPYDHWFLEHALPEDACEAITALPFDPPDGAEFSGRRETNNATRVYFSPEMQARYPICRQVAEVFKDAHVISALKQETGADLSDGALRIEYCQDTDGFWLEPHTDISVKLFTMLIYLADDPALADAGTDVYEGPPNHKLVGRAPYGRGRGLIFIPGENTWHGVAKRAISGVRKSIIVNFVTPEWRDRWELA